MKAINVSAHKTFCTNCVEPWVPHFLFQLNSSQLLCFVFFNICFCAEKGNSVS